MADKIDWIGFLKTRKMQLVILALAIAVALILAKGLNTGIEFSGGVRIPITLEKAVDSQTMDSMVETIKLRINKFGLSQSVVRPVGNDQILVEIPKASPDAIESVRNILKQQGRFEALIDGQDALTGGDVLPGAVGGANQESVLDTTSGKEWQLGFAVSREGGQRFANTAVGKGNYPVYMFLDRPQNAVLIVRKAAVQPNQSLGLYSDSIQLAIDDALRKQSDNIGLVYAEDFNSNSSLANYSTIVVEDGVQNISLISKAIADRNVTVKVFSTADSKPDYSPIAAVGAPLKLSVSSWTAIGLISSPILSPQLADGRVSQLFQVSGPAVGSTPAEQLANAQLELRQLKSVISGGKLPVSTSIGSSFTVAPSLGERFLQYSWIALLVGFAAVSLVIYLRYKHLFLVLPIVFFNMVEVIITTAIIGVFGTLDLSSMAGIIVLMGSGVADQIVLTEEMLRKGHSEEAEEHDEYENKERVKKAFYVIFTVAGVVIAAMLPLILSGIVEVIGFGVSTVIGVLVGVLITRPAYGDFMKMAFQKKG